MASRYETRSRRRQGISSSSKQGVFGVMIFDTLTDRSVGPQGYIIVDTPSRGQIVRVADYTAFMYLGKLIEYDETAKVFENPREQLTERYITGKFG